MADHVVVPATPRELDAIARIEEESFPSPWRREFFESELHAEGRYNRVLKSRKNEVVGYLFAMHFLDEMHINKIAVTEEYRRAGLANLMMTDCLAFAKRLEVRTISLEVRESNESAQQFYRKLDFHSVYRRPAYYPDGETAIVMTKEL
jgi:[ribosomal protein S18]-alanine N-acetyltransferase